MKSTNVERQKINVGIIERQLRIHKYGAVLAFAENQSFLFFALAGFRMRL
jgi:hypothetical protein